MRKSLVCAVAAVCATAATSFAATGEPINLGDAQIVRHWNFGEFTGGPEVVTPGAVYSNRTTAVTSGTPAQLQIIRNLVVQDQGGTTGSITNMVMDDLTPVAGGTGISQMTFSVANLNADTVFFRPRVRFWNADGAAGGPGTYYNGGTGNVGFTFNPIAIAPGVTLLTGTIATTPTVLFPTPTSRIWAGMTFDNNNRPGEDVGQTGIGPFMADNAQMGLLGQALFNPVDVGLSNSAELYVTTAAGSFFGTANPAGAITTAGSFPANLGWELVATPIPEPASLSLLGLGAAGMLRRRR